MPHAASRLACLLMFALAAPAWAASPPASSAPASGPSAAPPSATAPTQSAGPARATPTEPAVDRQLAALVKQGLIPGQAVQLKAGGQDFLGLFLPAQGPDKQGAAILLPDLGAHPDWPGVIAALRRGLPRHGWATLSIQLPLPAPGPQPPDIKALLDAAPARIQAAIAYLQQQGLRNLVLIGHGLGAAMGADYLLQQGKQANVQAFVGISMGSPPYLKPGGDPRLDLPAQLAKLTLPVLDLYGERDLPAVLASAPARAQAGRTGPAGATTRYTQFSLPGADHSFDDAGAALVRQVRGWLKHQAAGMVVTRPPGK